MRTGRQAGDADTRDFRHTLDTSNAGDIRGMLERAPTKALSSPSQGAVEHA